MKYLISLWLLFLSNQLWAKVDFRSGDLILVPLNCYSCPIIEDETQSDYSHSGVVLKMAGEIFVAEALGKVKLTRLSDFLKRVRPGKRAGLYRIEDFQNTFEEELNTKLLNAFNRKFEGLPFDSKYLWNNHDAFGREKLYCSEFVAKFLNPFLNKKFQTVPLDYSRNYDYWYRTWGGKVPNGVEGNSPGDLERASFTYFVDYL